MSSIICFCIVRAEALSVHMTARTRRSEGELAGPSSASGNGAKVSTRECVSSTSWTPYTLQSDSWKTICIPSTRTQSRRRSVKMCRQPSSIAGMHPMQGSPASVHKGRQKSCTPQANRPHLWDSSGTSDCTTFVAVFLDSTVSGGQGARGTTRMCMPRTFRICHALQ